MQEGTTSRTDFFFAAPQGKTSISTPHGIAHAKQLGRDLSTSGQPPRSVLVCPCIYLCRSASTILRFPKNSFSATLPHTSLSSIPLVSALYPIPRRSFLPILRKALPSLFLRTTTFG